jgi:hypothetical protein
MLVLRLVTILIDKIDIGGVIVGNLLHRQWTGFQPILFNPRGVSILTVKIILFWCSHI